MILVAQTKPLTRTLVRAAMDANPHGNGLAWIETSKGKKGKLNKTVRFEKGLTRKEFERFSLALPLPYVFHARIASVGGVHARLTHPFPIGARPEQIKLSGSNRRGVLFHNGTWSGWSAFYDLKNNAQPDALWSDTRAMADLVHHLGEQVLDVIPGSQKLVRLTTDGVTMLGDGWTEVAKGVQASNRYFLPSRMMSTLERAMLTGLRPKMIHELEEM